MRRRPAFHLTVRTERDMNREVVKAFYGSFFHAPVYGEFEFLDFALIEVNDKGYIERVVKRDDPEQPSLLREYRNRNR